MNGHPPAASAGGSESVLFQGREGFLERFARTMRSHAWLVLLCMLIVGIAGLAVGLTRDREYTARTGLLLGSQQPVAGTGVAGVPKHSTSRSVVAFTLLGLAAGLLLGILLAILLDRFDRRLKTIEQLEEVYQLPVLSRVPRSRSLGKRGRRGQEEALNATLGFSEEAEAFRALRANLRYFHVDRAVKSVLVCSPLSGDGKSTIARYLATTMAAMGDRVVLV